MPKTETLRRFHVEQACGWDGVMQGDEVLHVPRSMLDYPIVRYGDSKVVLAADREELAEAYEDAARKAMDTGDHTAGPLAGVDAIIAKLGLREVEGSVEMLEDSQRPVRIGKEWVLLKPSPTSKEESGATE